MQVPRICLIIIIIIIIIIVIIIIIIIASVNFFIAVYLTYEGDHTTKT